MKNVVFAASKTNFDVKVIGDQNVNIEGCTFATAITTSMGKGKRTIYIGAYSADLIVKNCTFDDKVYAFNIYGNAKTADVKFENCNLNGWMSGAAKFVFKSCVFGKSGNYADFIPYSNEQYDNNGKRVADAYFDGCTFNNGFEISLQNAKYLKFNNNCVMGTKTITAARDINWSYDGDGSAAENTVDVAVKFGSSYSAWSTTATEVLAEDDSYTWTSIATTGLAL